MTTNDPSTETFFGLAALISDVIHDAGATATACASCPASIWYIYEVKPLREIDKVVNKVPPTGLACHCTQMAFQSWGHNLLGIVACTARNILLKSLAAPTLS